MIGTHMALMALALVTACLAVRDVVGSRPAGAAVWLALGVALLAAERMVVLGLR